MSSHSNDADIPDGAEFRRVTPEFDEHTIPAALLDNHQIAAGTWGLLRVTQGSLEFIFDDQPDQPRSLGAGESIAIPPQRSHKVAITGPTRFSVEFYRASSTPA